MTENEAIEVLKGFGEKRIEFTINKLMTISENFQKEVFDRFTNSIEMALSALEEIQQYRAIGTVEECRETRERQRAKEPVNLEYVRGDYSWMRECPCCGAYVSEKKEYCLICGQHLNWENQFGLHSRQ